MSFLGAAGPDRSRLRPHNSVSLIKGRIVTGKLHSVSIGELVVSKTSTDVLVAYGLGSCVAICMIDSVSGVAGMLHALLPSSASSRDSGNVTKFVDKGVPVLLQEMEKAGAKKRQLDVYMCGGAQMLTAPGFNNTLNIGARNVAAAETTLKDMGLHFKMRDTGGNSGRTVKLLVSTGKITVRTLGQGEKPLN